MYVTHWFQREKCSDPRSVLDGAMKDQRDDGSDLRSRFRAFIEGLRDDFIPNASSNHFPKQHFFFSGKKLKTRKIYLNILNLYIFFISNLIFCYFLYMSRQMC